MDRGDVANALQISGMTDEMQDWMFEEDIDPNKKRPSVIVNRNVK